MFSISRVHLQSAIAIVGCEIVPYVQIRRSDGSTTTEDTLESGHFLSYKW